MWIFGVIFALIGVGLLFASRAQARRHQTLATTEASSVADLRELSASVASELGPGYFNEVTEISGAARADEALVAPLSQQKCVHYHVRVVHEYEEKDATGDEVKMKSGSDTVTDERRGDVCDVDDGSASVRVALSDATLTLEKSHSSFVPGHPAEGVLRAGMFEAPIGRQAAGRKTRGFRLSEEIIPWGASLYVRGVATDSSGRLTMTKPDDGVFTVSVKSRAATVDAAAKSARGLKVAGLVMLAIGCALFAVGLFAG